MLVGDILALTEIDAFEATPSYGVWCQIAPRRNPPVLHMTHDVRIRYPSSVGGATHVTRVMYHRIVTLTTAPNLHTATTLRPAPREAPPDMSIRPGQVKFGRHESFPLRFGWIAKGLSALHEHASVFTHEDATVTLGVGKNMVSSIDTGLLPPDWRDPWSWGQGLELSAIAQVAFAPHADPYLEDDGTIWLLHWLLATNPAGATAIYWFFNHFHSISFTTDEVATALRDFVHRDISPRTAVSTLNRDAALVLRMYARSRLADRLALEDSLDSPLAMLGLQRRIDNRTWRSVPEARSDIPTLCVHLCHR